MRSLWVGLLAGLVTAACTGGGSIASPQPVASPSPAITIVPPTTVSPITPKPQLTPSVLKLSPTPLATPVSTPLAKMDVEHVFPDLSFRRMVAMAYPDDGTTRLFLALQPGQVMVFPNDQAGTSASTFLDIRERVNDRGEEEGLLGLAFDPGYRTNGYFYVYYSASNPRSSIISRFSVSRADTNAADPESERTILVVPQPFANHNGGQLTFGLDGYLYIGLGDGGAAGDPNKNGQNSSTLLGSILRIDVSSLDRQGTYSVPDDNPFAGQGGVRQEVWAYGLRNPWRFTVDRTTGDLWAGDVGQNRFEEIDIIRPGLNYGWNIMEGFDCFQPREGCNQQGLELPVVEYALGDGNCSVIGGYVYRGTRLPSLYGAYMYGDFCSGKIWALRHDGTQVTEHLEIVDSGLRISSFAEDHSGEVLILSFDNKIYRLKPR